MVVLLLFILKHFFLSDSGKQCFLWQFCEMPTTAVSRLNDNKNNNQNCLHQLSQRLIIFLLLHCTHRVRHDSLSNNKYFTYIIYGNQITVAAKLIEGLIYNILIIYNILGFFYLTMWLLYRSQFWLNTISFHSLLHEKTVKTFYFSSF